MASMKFKTKIKGETLRNKQLKKFDGKEVTVEITEVKVTKKRKWESISSISLAGHFDKVNVRDFAYE